MKARHLIATIALALAALAGAAQTGSSQTPDGPGEVPYGSRARQATSRPIGIGSRVEGSLAVDDPTFPDGSRFQVWRFSVRAGQDVAVRLESHGFDGLLMLVAAAGESEQPLRIELPDDTARVVRFALRSPRAADYLIVVNAQEAGGRGGYRLSLQTLAEACTTGGPCAIEDIGLTPLSRVELSAARAIALGESQTGELSRTDGRLLDSAYFDAWHFEGAAGERIVIDHSSSAFDTYLILARQTPNGPESVRENDDAPFTANSQVAVELPETGTYVIITTSIRPDTTGPYTLRLRSMAVACAAGGPCEPSARAGEQRPFFEPVRTARVQAIALGETATGRLAQSDRTLGDETFFDAYRFSGTADSEVAIFLTARAPDVGRLDTYLHLLRLDDDSIVVVESDDDGGGGKNSLVTARLPRDGQYFAVANGLTMADTGNYTITVMTLAAACAARGVCELDATVADVSAVETILATPAQPIAAGAPVRGGLTGHGPKLPDDKPFEVWRYRARTGERIVVTSHSAAFDSYLYLYRVTGSTTAQEIGRDDDGGGSLDAQLAVELPEAGDYLLVATSFSATARGEYTLTVEPMAVACAAGGPCAPGENSSATARIRPALTAAHQLLPAMDTVRAALADSAPRLPGSGRFQSYRFRGRANERVVIAMESPRFDPYLHLALIRGPSMRLVGSDDDGGPGTGSRLVATLPEDGEYLVVASAYSGSDTTAFGAYSISMSPCDSACAAYSESPVARSQASYANAIRAERRPIASGASVESELLVTDSTLSDGAQFHGYWIQAVEGQHLRAGMQASAFDPFLALLRLDGDSLVWISSNDDGGDGLNSFVEWPVTSAGTYVIVATAVTSTSLGPYSLNVEQGPESGRERFLAIARTAAVRPQLNQALAAQHQRLQLGQTLRSEMTGATRLEERGRFQSFRFNGRGDDRIVLTMESEQLDPYLYLAGIDGGSGTLISTDDDGGDGANSRIVATLPATGEYLVIASAYSAAGDSLPVAAYSIRLDTCDAGCLAYRDAPGSRSTASYRVALRTPRRQIPASGVVQDMLATTDSALSDGARFHAYSVQGAAGQTLRAALQATQFDPYLALFRHERDSLFFVASDDDGGEGVNALLEWPVDRSGAYVLVATAFSSSSTGSYTLNFEQGPESGHDEFVATAATSAARGQLRQALAAPRIPLPMGESVRGEMTDETPRLDGRGRFQAYRFNGRGNDRVVVTLESERFDPYLYLVLISGPAIRIVGTDDDGGDGTNSRLVATLPATGEYMVVASVYGASDSTGVSPYTVRVAPCDDACASEAALVSPTPRTDTSGPLVLRAPRLPLPLGQPVLGRLVASDSTLADSSHFHAYSIRADSGASLRASMDAEDFDALLVLYRADGDSLLRVASDDDGGDGLNALLTWTVDRTADYVLVANTISRGATGGYTLTASLTPGPGRLH